MSGLLLLPVAMADSGVYATRVAIVEGTPEPQLIGQALGQVVVNLTASVASLAEPSIQAGQQQAADYVRHITSLKTDDGQYLQIGFDRPAVDLLLRQAGLPIWGADRLSVISWLVIERQGLQEVISDDGNMEALLLRQAAEERGIPLLFPLMDLSDQSLLSISDIGGQFWEPIQQASQRYQAQGIVIGRIYQTIDGYWHGQGQLNLPDGISSWQLEAPTIEALLAQLVEQLGAMLVNSYALHTATLETNQLLLQVSGVGDLSSYGALLQTLAAINGVTNVSLQSLQGDTVLLQLTHQGAIKKLLHSLGLVPQLALLDGQQGNAYSATHNASTAYYVWQ